jgi:hypothetical protein
MMPSRACAYRSENPQQFNAGDVMGRFSIGFLEMADEYAGLGITEMIVRSLAHTRDWGARTKRQLNTR